MIRTENQRLEEGMSRVETRTTRQACWSAGMRVGSTLRWRRDTGYRLWVKGGYEAWQLSYDVALDMHRVRRGTGLYVSNGKFPVNSQYRQWAPVHPIDSTSARLANVPEHAPSLALSQPSFLVILHMFLFIIASANPTQLGPPERTSQAPETTLRTRYYRMDFQSFKIKLYKSTPRMINTLFHRLMDHSDTYIHFLHANIFPT